MVRRGTLVCHLGEPSGLVTSGPHIIHWMARSVDPAARYQVRRPSAEEATRSVSERTLVATENAMAARAAESHRTANRAPPLSRRGESDRSLWSRLVAPRNLRDALGSVGILNIYDAVHVNRDGDGHQRQARRVRDQGLHIHADGGWEIRLIPDREPGFAHHCVLVSLLIRNVAIGQTICQNEGLRSRLTGQEI